MSRDEPYLSWSDLRIVGAAAFLLGFLCGLGIELAYRLIRCAL